MIFLYSILIFILIFGVMYLFRNFQQKKYLNILSQDQFIKGYRKAQLIDIREPQEFDRGYIRGARNIPLTQMKQRLIELRPDKPVYLYGQGNGRSKRAAHLLYKNNYQKIYMLDGGFKKWTGKVDSK